MKSAEAALLPIQLAQQEHDLLAHRDILALDTQTRLKHMTLHFLKYAGKIAAAGERRDRESLVSTIVDSFIICLATANTLNVSLGAHIESSVNTVDDLARELAHEVGEDDLFWRALHGLVKVAGQMAKSIESTDHLERGNPRAELEALIVELSRETLIVAGSTGVSLEASIRQRWNAVEAKSIFSTRLATQ
jgi:hypothetical protein